MRRSAAVSLGVAVAYSLVLLAAGFWVPLYSSESVTSSGGSTSSTETLVEVNGVNVLLVLSVPLLITVLVAGALRAGSRAAAWGFTGALGAFAVLGALSIGAFVLPAFVALAFACALARPASGEAGADGI